MKKLIILIMISVFYMANANSADISISKTSRFSNLEMTKIAINGWEADDSDAILIKNENLFYLEAGKIILEAPGFTESCNRRTEIDSFSGIINADDSITITKISGTYTSDGEFTFIDDNIICVNKKTAKIDKAKVILDGNDIVIENIEHGGANFTLKPTVNYNTKAMVTVDLNNDGYADLIFGNENGNNEVFLNQKNSFLKLKQTIPNPNKTRDIAIADINNNGYQDMVIANHGTPDLIFLNDGSGNLIKSGEIDNGVYLNDTNSLKLADFDLDGNIDLVISNSLSSGSLYSLFVYLNDGEGNFLNIGGYLTYSRGIRDVEVADINNDGNIDIVANGETATMFLINNGNAEFTTLDNPSTPKMGLDNVMDSAILDINGDGYLDIINASLTTNDIWLNAGGHFTRSSQSPEGKTRSITVGDVNNDGFSDIVFSNYERENKILLNDGFGYFSTLNVPFDSNIQTESAVIIDIDNDGNKEILFGNNGGNTTIKIDF
ncbi:FG-GAP repeat domain-containing protein [Shewanella surugensis]|uniref:VCBS repeat-containing protein n=1 Tax=Shewanella surugensis TaxID=212020 RepID=A0ABT0L923_9GAMM|nr:VCBS repeat-containing protein [Shewanella surugensis]MCL1123651.1 VCBS repeat-containing protein [Shewanella surugensis]